MYIGFKLLQVLRTHLALCYYSVFSNLRWQWKSGPNSPANNGSRLAGLKRHFDGNFSRQFL